MVCVHVCVCTCGVKVGRMCVDEVQCIHTDVVVQ